MKYTVLDIETDGLLETVSRIHCLSYQVLNENLQTLESGSLTNPDEIITFLEQQECLVGHNIIRYDIPVLEKLLNIEIKINTIDTLGWSWYLYPMRIKHGLELWGDELGVPKPIINDWENLSVEDYIHRCESDVEINTRLFLKQFSYMRLIYGTVEKALNFNLYLNFKLDCAREQEKVKCKVNRTLVLNTMHSLNSLKSSKIQALSEAMPRDIKYKERNKPASLYKKDGDLSVRGKKWLDLLHEHNLPFDYEGPVMVVDKDLPGNPISSIQIKKWLEMLSWQPRKFEARKNKAGEIKEVPQVYDGEEVCESIKELFDVEPALENLNMLSIIKHRIGIFQSYLDEIDDNDYVKATVRGFTNTLRFKHSRPLVNLPSIYKPYGEQIRGALIKPSEDHLLCGSDMSSLEDTTKQHYMYFFDPEYVMEMRVPGFDPHLDIAVLAEMMSKEESEEFKRIKKKASLFDKGKGPEPSEEEKSLFSRLNKTRSSSKTVNFAGVYGAGPPKIAKTLNSSLSFAKNLHTTYWNRNRSVKQVANSVTVRIIYKDDSVRDLPSSRLNNMTRKSQEEFFKKVKQMWLLNPISGFYYSLRYPKDIFSTLNQGSGVYCFDLWVREVRKKGIEISMQYHDEIMFSLKKEDREKVETILRDAIEEVNSIVKLNVPLGISVDIGDNYAEIH